MISFKSWLNKFVLHADQTSLVWLIINSYTISKDTYQIHNYQYGWDFKTGFVYKNSGEFYHRVSSLKSEISRQKEKYLSMNENLFKNHSSSDYYSVATNSLEILKKIDFHEKFISETVDNLIITSEKVRWISISNRDFFDFLKNTGQVCLEFEKSMWWGTFSKKHNNPLQHLFFNAFKDISVNPFITITENILTITSKIEEVYINENIFNFKNGSDESDYEWFRSFEDLAHDTIAKYETHEPQREYVSSDFNIVKGEQRVDSEIYRGALNSIDDEYYSGRLDQNIHTDMEESLNYVRNTMDNVTKAIENFPSNQI